MVFVTIVQTWILNVVRLWFTVYRVWPWISDLQAAFYGLLLRLFYLCFFIVSGISCYKSYHKSSLEALKLCCCRTVVDRPSWNWRVVAHDYVAYNFFSDVLLRIYTRLWFADKLCPWRQLNNHIDSNPRSWILVHLAVNLRWQDSDMSV